LGYADAADGAVPGQPANTIEIRYTLLGDSNLDGIVDATDAVTLGRNYNLPNSAKWDSGDFNYDGAIDMNDALILRTNWNLALPAPASPSAAMSPTPADQSSNSTSNSQSLIPAIDSTAPVASNPVLTTNNSDVETDSTQLTTAGSVTVVANHSLTSVAPSGTSSTPPLSLKAEAALLPPVIVASIPISASVFAHVTIPVPDQAPVNPAVKSITATSSAAQLKSRIRSSPLVFTPQPVATPVQLDDKLGNVDPKHRRFGRSRHQ
jgi:hypothetical protein